MTPPFKSLPTAYTLAVVPLPPLYRQRTVQAVAGAALSLTATWLAAAPISSFLLSRRTGLRVSIRYITLSRAGLGLRQVKLAAKDGSELARATLVTFGHRKKEEQTSSSSSSSPSSDLNRPLITAHDPSFTVAFSDSNLRHSNWDLCSTSSSWLPRIALTGDISFAVVLAGIPPLSIRATHFGHIALPSLHGFTATVDLVRRFTRTTLRRDVRSLPKQFRSAARRIGREAIISDFEHARSSTVEVVDELRTTARKIDDILNGLPDLEYYRDIARRSESFLHQIADWLGSDIPPERQPAAEQNAGQIRPEERGYRVLDEDPVPTS